LGRKKNRRDEREVEVWSMREKEGKAKNEEENCS
jgi:hypothetical protein